MSNYIIFVRLHIYWGNEDGFDLLVFNADRTQPFMTRQNVKLPAIFADSDIAAPKNILVVEIVKITKWWN